MREAFVLCEKITYKDFDELSNKRWKEHKIPNELFVKSKKFEHQEECRIVINTDNPKLKEMLSKPISIEPMKDIAGIAELKPMEK